jgi:hypothetical protein
MRGVNRLRRSGPRRVPVSPVTAKRQVDRLISAFGDIAAELAA